MAEMAFPGRAVALAVGARLSLAAQSAMMNGVAIGALTGANIATVLSDTQWVLAPVSSAMAITSAVIQLRSTVTTSAFVTDARLPMSPLGPTAVEAYVQSRSLYAERKLAVSDMPRVSTFSMSPSAVISGLLNLSRITRNAATASGPARSRMSATNWSRVRISMSCRFSS